MVFTAAFVAMKNACCAAAATPPVDYEAVVRCDPATGASVLVISAIDPVTGIPTPAAYNLDGTAYAGAIGALTACDTPETESDPVEMCDGGAVNFLRCFIKRDGAITGSVNTDLAGVVYVPVGPVTMGACSPALAARNINHEAQNFAGGTFAASHDPNGNGAVWVYPGAGKLQSVTVTVLEAGTPASGNAVQVKQGAAGTVVFLVKGQSNTWSVAQDDSNTNEQLDPNIDIQALGNSAFTVAWTEEL